MRLVCSISVSAALSLSLTVSWAMTWRCRRTWRPIRADFRVSSSAASPRATIELPEPFTDSANSSSCLRRAISRARSLPLWVAAQHDVPRFQPSEHPPGPVPLAAEQRRRRGSRQGPDYWLGTRSAVAANRLAVEKVCNPPCRKTDNPPPSRSSPIGTRTAEHRGGDILSGERRFPPSPRVQDERWRASTCGR